MRALAVVSLSILASVPRPDVDPVSASTDSAQAFRSAWSAMLDFDTLSYVKVVESDVPGLVSGSSLQSGAYQVSTATGFGAFAIVLDKSADELREMPMPGHDDLSFGEAMELVGGQQLQLRLVDDVFWQGIPQPAGRKWIGVPVENYPGDVSGAFDGVALLDGAFSSSELQVLSQNPAADGGTDWVVSVDSDSVGPLGAQSGTYQRLIDAGFDGQTDGYTEVAIHVDAAGFVGHVEATLSDWWRNAIGEANVQPGDTALAIDVRLDVRYAALEMPLNVTAPCADPIPDIQGGIDVLVCPPGR